MEMEDAKPLTVYPGTGSYSNSDTSEALYDVFLSFRGPDTRQGFVDCLYHFIRDAGIRVFKDDEDLRPGEKIVEVLEAIKCSRICIPIFSRDYPSSKWCMRELARMVELEKKIVPIFYDVTPDDVKLRTDLYRDKLKVYGEEFTCEKAGWDEALVQAASISGCELGAKGFGEFCKSIARKISLILKVKERNVSDNLVGIDVEVSDTMALLDVEANDVRYIGIHGMGGVGKTTLAKVIFNQLHASYNSCSFAENVRETSSSKGIASIQKQMLDNLGSVLPDCFDSDEGMRKIRSAVRSQKILIVLDDVDQVEQINKLAGMSFPFGPGSRIIITTRNTNVLTHLGEVRIHELTGLEPDPALQLFSRHAFASESPPPAYASLSKSIVSITRGLPLALEVIGSRLYLRGIDEWEEVVNSIGTNYDIQKALMTSYEALEARTKQIFLDIACFFNNKEKTNCMYMWRACNFYPNKGLEELISLSLIKILNGDTLWMHDLLVELGRETVRMESFADVTKRSRIWTNEEAAGILHMRQGRENIQALSFSCGEKVLTRGNFDGMRNLRFLEVHRVKLNGDFEGIFPGLKWLCWDCSYQSSYLINLDLPNLVVLDLTWVVPNETWIKMKMEHLKVLVLNRCSRVSTILNFSKYRSLERLVLERCYGLTEIHSSISMARSLRYLIVYECQDLKGLPEEIGELEHLEEIIVKGEQGERGDFTLPKSIGNLQSLSVLKVEQLILREIPLTMGRLEKLRQLSLPFTGLDCLPNSLGNLKSLVELDLSGATIIELPDAFINVKQLKVLKMRRCSLHKLRAIKDMAMLEELDIGWNPLLLEVPVEIGNMTHLRVLDCTLTGICLFPSTVDQLSCLQELDLTDCHNLQELPRLPKGLTRLHVSSKSFHKVPNLSELVNLIDLMLSNAANHNYYFYFAPVTSAYPQIPRKQLCSPLSSLSQPSTSQISSQSTVESYSLDWIKNLTMLESLYLDLSVVTIPPSQLSDLSHLKTLRLSCRGWKIFPRFPSSLTSLTIGYLQPAVRLPDLSNLGSLTFLCFISCLFPHAGMDLQTLGVGQLQSLRTLSLTNCDFTKFDGEHLPESLLWLNLSQCCSLRTIENLSHLGKLLDLRVYLCGQLSEITMPTGKCMVVIGCKSLERCLETLKSTASTYVLKWV